MLTHATKKFLRESKSIKSYDRTEIYYEVAHVSSSSRKFLVFLHGLGGDLTAWESERNSFHHLGYSTIAVDLRGHGLSGRPNNESSYSLNNFAFDILEVLRNEKAKKVALIGHCFGGMVALSLEGTYPKTSKALVLVDTSYKPPWFGQIATHSLFLQKIVRLIGEHIPEIRLKHHADFAKFKGSWDWDAKRLLSDILHTSLKSYLLLCDSLCQFNATELLQRISVPTLIIEGTRDSIFPPKVAKELNHRIKKSQIEFVDDANHIIIINNPKDLVIGIQKFLKKIKF